MNDSCWLTTSGPKILQVKVRNKVARRCRLRKRAQINSIKGKEVKSAAHATKIEAEMSLCRFHYNMENKAGKGSVLKRSNKLIENDKSPPAAEVSIENNSNGSLSDATLSPRCEDKCESSSKSATSSATLVKFDAKGDRKESNSHLTKKCKEMSMSHKCAIDSSARTHNPKSSGLFGISIDAKTQKRAKKRLLLCYQQHKHLKLLAKQDAMRNAMIHKLQRQILPQNIRELITHGNDTEVFLG